MKVVVLLMIVFALGCGKKALFDELAENRLKVVIKGTYESNDPRSRLGAFPDDNSIDDGIANTELPTRLMLDIAEIQLLDKEGGVEPFSKYREVYTLDLNDSEPFFSGMGIGHPNDDVEAGRLWTGMRLFLRKMVFDGAMQYHLIPGEPGIGTWTSDGKLYTIFDVDSVEGLDVNPLQVNTYYDSLKQNAKEINRIFPLKIPIIGGLNFNYANDETVLEIRLVFKNFVKRYEYDFVRDGYHYIYRYFGPSDWLRDVVADDAVIGGNIIAVARSYVRGKTVDITNAHTTGITVVANSYVAAVGPDSLCASLNRPSVVRPTLRTSGTPPAQCDNPKGPHVPIPNDIESYLDYYLKYEKYKENYNLFAACVSDGSFSTLWDEYNDSRNAYLLPAVATWTSDGSFTLKNVPYNSSWKICHRQTSPGAGDLPEFTDNAGDFVVVTIDGGGNVAISP